MLASCVDPSSVRCPDGSVCPDGTACETVDDETSCVLPGQITSCDGKLELDAPPLSRLSGGAFAYDAKRDMSCMATRGCGDGTCDPITESCTTCAIDCACGASCGNFACEAGESAANCPGDCP